ncbi:nucleotide-binding alpha-beta plait domain-containing protein, partial [Tanacetum coccineum]
MGNFRTKEDDVSRISTSIFVSNFPDSYSSKDLFHACKQYGHVVDSFIPSKRAKDGKRFGISVETDSTPTIMLDDECLNVKDLSCSLMGRVKEFASIPNLKKVLCNEGFDALKISYLGELWVLLEFESAKVKDLSGTMVERARCFRFLIKLLMTLFRMEELYGWKWRVSPLNYGQNLHSNALLQNEVCENILESFKIVFRGKVYWLRANEVHGWTPEFTEEEEEEDT